MVYKVGLRTGIGEESERSWKDPTGARQRRRGTSLNRLAEPAHVYHSRREHNNRASGSPIKTRRRSVLKAGRGALETMTKSRYGVPSPSMSGVTERACGRRRCLRFTTSQLGADDVAARIWAGADAQLHGGGALLVRKHQPVRSDVADMRRSKHVRPLLSRSTASPMSPRPTISHCSNHTRRHGNQQSTISFSTADRRVRHTATARFSDNTSAVVIYASAVQRIAPNVVLNTDICRAAKLATTRQRPTSDVEPSHTQSPATRSAAMQAAGGEHGWVR